VTDIEQRLRECLARNAGDVQPALTLADDARARSRQLARRARVTAVCALLPMTAGLGVASAALAGVGSGSHSIAKVQSVTTAPASPAPSLPSGIATERNTCPAGQVPNLRRLDKDTRLASRSIGISGFIRRYEQLHGAEIAALWQVPEVAVDGGPLSNGSYAIEIETRLRTYRWKLMIGEPASDGHVTSRKLVYNATKLGCVEASEL
jgi:hypothetical protein